MHRRLALIADDCQLTCALHAEVLQRVGFRTVTVASGAAAASEVRRALATDGTRFDLILLDYDMPDGDGPSAARLIRGIGVDRYPAPMYCVSSHAAERIEVSCLAAGFDGVLSKPLVLDTALLAGIAPASPDRSRSKDPRQAAGQPASSRPGSDWRP
jgi:CheY-like chemotaxis protein